MKKIKRIDNGETYTIFLNKILVKVLGIQKLIKVLITKKL